MLLPAAPSRHEDPASPVLRGTPPSGLGIVTQDQVMGSPSSKDLHRQSVREQPWSQEQFPSVPHRSPLRGGAAGQGALTGGQELRQTQ
jgi:hypothetical protein